MKKRIAKNRIALSVTAALLLFCMMSVMPLPVFAADETGTRVVRAAAEDSGLFLTMDSDGEPVSGYAYEYIGTIAAYSGWKVEYVTYPSFSECVQALAGGDADILYDVSYSPEREEMFLYPDAPMGTENYYLYCLPGNSSIYPMDYSSYDGKRVGVTAGTLQIGMLKQWIEEKNLSMDIVEFDSLPEKEAALEAGVIDFDLEIGMLTNHEYSALDKIASSDYYLVVAGDRGDLLDDINGTVSKILSIDRKFFDHLEETYFSGSLVSKSLTKDETEWVAGHGTLTVGYMNHYLPFSDTGDNGEVKGIVKDIIPLMLRNISLDNMLSVSYTGYDDNEEMYAALASGEVDCVFPVYGTMNYALEKKALFTSRVIGINIDLAFTGRYLTDAETTAVIAVNRNNHLQDYYTRLYYPGAEIVYFDTISECLDAVADGKAGSTILNGMRTTDLLRSGDYNNINTASLPEKVDFCFAVREGNAALLSIINRALANTDDSAAVTFSYQNLSNERAPVTPAEFFRQHPEYLYGAAAVLLAIAFAIGLYRRRQENLRAENERKRQIAKMAGGVSSYIVNPVTGVFQIIGQNQYLEDNYTADEDFNTSITRYIAHDVYGPDRKAAAEAISIPAMLDALREDNEYVFRYRDISTGTPRWYELHASMLSEKEILYGFYDRNREIISRLVLDKMAGEYTALYYVNLDTDDYVSYHLISKTEDIRKFYDNNPKFTGLAHGFARSELVYPDDRDSLIRFYPSSKDVKETLKDRRMVSMLFRRNYGGEYLWTEASIVKCEGEYEEAHEVIVGFIEKDRDVRERARYQMQLEEARSAAEAASRSKTNFLFNMSHDIRTPMNAITGFTKMAKKYIDDKEKTADYLDKIDTSGQQLLSLVNQVLEMARIESGKTELEEKPVNVREEYEAAVTVLAEQAKVNGLSFRYSLSDVVHNYILADPARMNSITLNIAGNAMKYTPRGGSVEFALKEVPSGKDGYASFVLTVEDTGIGMSEEYQKVLFDPFTREKSSTVSKIQGTGLGLSIVKELVDLMGGTVEVKSELGKGTRFDISVDFRIDENAGKTEKAPDTEAEVSLAGHRALLVEDNALNREIAMEILDENGLFTENADDGTTAVEMLREKGPDYYDFILMDIQMPVMNGYEATKAIREMYPEKHIPVIALSANAFAEDKTASIEAGMDDHVAKPIDIRELVAALSRFL